MANSSVFVDINQITISLFDWNASQINHRTGFLAESSSGNLLLWIQVSYPSTVDERNHIQTDSLIVWTHFWNFDTPNTQTFILDHLRKIPSLRNLSGMEGLADELARDLGHFFVSVHNDENHMPIPVVIVRIIAVRRQELLLLSQQPSQYTDENNIGTVLEDYLKKNMDLQEIKKLRIDQSRGLHRVVASVVTKFFGYEDEVKDCPICLEQFCMGEKVKQLRCFHMFHYKCILQWLFRASSCPVCRDNCRVPVSCLGMN